MKKRILAFVTVLLVAGTLSAQSFEKGLSAINVGVGFGPTINNSGYNSMTLPSISGSYEYGIAEISMGNQLMGVISVGGYLGGMGMQYVAPGYTYNYLYMMIAGRANYHFIFHDQFDPYAGIQLGGYAVAAKLKENTTGGQVPAPYSGRPYVGIYAGARWYFTSNFGVFAEIGYNLSIFTTGVSFAF